MAISKTNTDKKKIAIIAHQAFSLYNFRGALIREIISRGFIVYALAPDYTEETKGTVISLGAIPIEYRLDRTGTNPVMDVVSFFQLINILRRLDVDVSFGYSIKPVLYGSCAAKLLHIPRIYSMIEGLGHIFIDDELSNSYKRLSMRSIVTFMYYMALRYNDKVFFLNPDDSNFFISRKLVGKDKVAQIPGIGVDLQHFALAPVSEKPVTFLLIARLLREKGIFEYIEAIRKVKENYPDIRCLLLGDIDTNPSSIKREQVQNWVAEGLVEWPGAVSDVRPWIASSSVFVLPSYREGVPRSTQEAMAMGRAVVTTDVPGCRETVDDGINGFIVPPRDSLALANAMCNFIRDPSLIRKMGMKSRKKCEARFNEIDINNRILAIMGI